jgi:hypothetical protein
MLALAVAVSLAPTFAGSQTRAAESQPLALTKNDPANPLQITPTAPLTLTPDSGTWDLSPYGSVEVKLRNAGQGSATVWARAENADAKGAQDCVRAVAVLEPGQAKTLRLRLSRRPEDPTYAPFKPFFMYFKDINVRDNTVDPAAIVRLVLWLEPAAPGQAVTVESAVTEGQGVAGPVPFLPLADKYGQYTHTDWPGKIYADTDFAARQQEEEEEMKLHPGPASWDKWGGWKDGPKQSATGFFYPQKVNDKWWLVDPDGALFWSYGPTGVGFGEGTPVTGRENWFADLPPASGETAKYWGAGRNARFMYYQNKEYKSFDFPGLNAERKYGNNWKEATADFMHRRLRNWGFNTVANWSDRTVIMRRKTPYVVAIGSGGPQLQHIPDVFDPRWAASLRGKMEQQRGTTAGDPWNIGYFVDNEWTWGIQPKAAVVSQGALKAPGNSVSKQTFIKDLQTKYSDISALNSAWGTAYASWSALQDSTALPPDTKNPKFKEDTEAFGEKFAEKYFSTVREEVKRVAPKNLYLGVRFNGHIDASLIQIAAKYTDVISYNIYEDPAGRLNQYVGKVDKPFLVGEFGVTSDICQMPWRGQVLSPDPNERVRAFEGWFAKGIRHPLLVGAHFFQFRDQPITGRGDGEATLRGLVNIADTPHFDLVQANRRLSYKLYETRAGK